MSPRVRHGMPSPTFLRDTVTQGSRLLLVNQLTPWHFVVWWYALLSLHAVCIGYYVGSASVYRRLVHTFISFQLRNNSIAIPESEYVKVAIIHEIVAAAHALFVISMVGGSLLARRLVFYFDFEQISQRILALAQRKRRFIPYSMIVPDSVVSTTRRPTAIASISQFVIPASSRVGLAVFGRHGLLGVDFVYFDHLLLVRELVEVTLQTYQAYRMTRLLPRLWLVRVYVALLVANCWVVPLLHRVYARRHRLRRMVALLCDAMLDIVSSIGVSLVIFCSYVPQYTDRLGFPFSNWYDDEWLVGVVQEFQIMMVVSWSDMACRLVFASGVLLAMDSIKDMLTDSLQAQGLSSVNLASRLPRPASRANAIRHDVRPVKLNGPLSPPPDSTSLPTTPIRITSRMQRALHALVHTIGPALFVIWGAVILVVHIYAESQDIDLRCKLPLRPWFSTKPSCSLVDIDCSAIKASGTSESIGDPWTSFDPSFTAGLFVRHCQDLTIPPSMVLYTEITTIKVYNSTLTSWPSGSGLTTISHGRLRAVYLIRTNFTDGKLPDGMTRSDFPQTFRSFFVSKSNLVSLPAHLDRSWPNGMAISIEHAPFTSVPDVLIRLKPGLVSFSCCPIARVPAALFEIPTLRDIFLLNTALQELPRDVTAPTSPNLLLLSGTNVSVFWPWVDQMAEQSKVLHKPFFVSVL